ncbi:hypothetical protein QTP70_035172, partial [Hemibagrus guttatus]
CVFSGRDASRAFVTGDFTESGLTDDVSDLSPSQIVALYDWLAFYQKDYKPVGKLIGRFYSKSGKPTAVLQKVEASLAQGLKLKAQAEKENKLYPACNSEWNSDRGGRVWCSTKSGGVHRDWAGVPRMLFSPGSGHTRCVCARLDDPTQKNQPKSPGVQRLFTSGRVMCNLTKAELVIIYFILSNMIRVDWSQDGQPERVHLKVLYVRFFLFKISVVFSSFLSH